MWGNESADDPRRVWFCAQGHGRVHFWTRMLLHCRHENVTVLQWTDFLTLLILKIEWKCSYLFTSNLWIYVSSPDTCGLLRQKEAHFMQPFLQSKFAICSAYWFSSVSIPVCFCFVMFYHKFWEANRKRNQIVWSCHPLLQLNHSAQKTEAKKVADLRMTIPMQNQHFHSGGYILSCLMGLRTVT